MEYHVGLFLLAHLMNLAFVEAVATAIEEWKKERDVPWWVERFSVPPLRCRVMMFLAYAAGVLRYAVQHQ